MTTNQPPDLDIRSLLESGFTEETARKLYAQGEEIVIFALLQLAALALKNNLTSTPCYKNAVNGTHPSTPSVTIPAFQKEATKKRNKKSGAKHGHPGSRRPPPVVNNHREHRAACCPDCGEKLRKRKDVRKSFDRYSVEKLSNCGRERVNINGAVDIDTLETVTDFADSINSQSTIRLFKKLEANHAETEVIHLIVDNATY